MPSLDDWEKNWKTLKPEMPKAEIKMPTVVQVDFQGQQNSTVVEGAEGVRVGVGQG